MLPCGRDVSIHACPRFTSYPSELKSTHVILVSTFKQTSGQRSRRNSSGGEDSCDLWRCKCYGIQGCRVLLDFGSLSLLSLRSCKSQMVIRGWGVIDDLNSKHQIRHVVRKMVAVLRNVSVWDCESERCVIVQI